VSPDYIDALVEAVRDPGAGRSPHTAQATLFLLMAYQVDHLTSGEYQHLSADTQRLTAKPIHSSTSNAFIVQGAVVRRDASLLLCCNNAQRPG
jgi:hypothetical protein